MYREMLEKLQFEQLKLSNDYQREVEEKKRLQAQIDGQKDGEANDNADEQAVGAPGATKEEVRMLTDQVKAWEVVDYFFTTALNPTLSCREKCES